MNKIKKTTAAETTVVDEPNNDKQIVTQESQIVKQEADIDGFLSQRSDFITKVNAIMVKGSDYHEIKGKKSLAKGGAEKIASIFHWTAKFEKDTEAIEMLGDIKGLVAFKCTLQNGQFVGEGRGAATLQVNAGDPNKTLKMAQKSAFIDGVLRASGLSDFFTQDLEDMNPNDIGQPTGNNYESRPVTNSYPPTEKQYEFIKSLMEQKRVDEAWVIQNGFTPLKDLTGGRNGTATELIEMLKNYIPTESVTRMDTEALDRLDESNHRVIERLSADAEQVLGELEVCFSTQEYGVLNKKISEMFTQGKFSNYDWSIIVSQAKKAVDRLKTNK